MKKRNLLPIILMASSIVLLLLLQTLWLVNSYDQAYNDFRRRTSDLFRGTLMEMRDSLFMKSFKQVPVDSIRAGRTMMFDFSVDTATTKHLRQRHSRAEIIISGKKDTMTNKVFIRLSQDTVSQDVIFSHYHRVLTKADIDLPFTVKKVTSLPSFIEEDMVPGAKQIRRRFAPGEPEIEEIPRDKSSMITEWMRFAPDVRYAAIFGTVRPYIYLQISPQITFSIALTLITSAAFLMMYRSMRSQQKLMDLKNDFISNITHELKTPVTTVSVALEALRNFKGLENPQTTREYLDIAQGELNRLTLLTDKVLKTAVFDKGTVNFENEQVDLHKTVDQILHSMKLIFEKQKAHVTFEQQGNAFTIRGGSIHLTNVIYNLLDNALKYSVSEPQISIRLEEDANRVILTVADKGIGIPAEYKKKIFEKFFRVPTGDIHNIKGYGLGLSYVESVVRSHRGLIEVISKPGEGSVFTISLPKGT
ncbi:MAG TPA: HAMP domain-containing sensor histidine kinase [Cyclobacteriaceae bacterium]